MEIKVAKNSLKSDASQSILTLEDMLSIVNENGKRGAIFYLDRENPEKNIKKIETFFKGKDHATIIREVRISMDEKDYIYEIHVL
ncbi:hypothetical protein LS73_004405 [Helicobacter muridarum]|uniref:HP0268 domain-containing protein n=1 Tax=Helicobacter muridarum TaxID=216 RepID=A0A099TYG1_9HELI|nr:HP0268 family nuclease [Helicobacter muridarum]TLE00431.1 hypothetical protein LS73_004405 [Helicobacter muridarum]STQ86401.1 Uncharacterised protein [Helicobacter muridarum]